MSTQLESAETGSIMGACPGPEHGSQQVQMNKMHSSILVPNQCGNDALAGARSEGMEGTVFNGQWIWAKDELSL